MGYPKTNGENPDILNPEPTKSKNTTRIHKIMKSRGRKAELESDPTPTTVHDSDSNLSKTRLYYNGLLCDPLIG